MSSVRQLVAAHNCYRILKWCKCSKNVRSCGPVAVKLQEGRSAKVLYALNRLWRPSFLKPLHKMPLVGKAKGVTVLPYADTTT
jgi:hypothetical protein